MLIEAGTDRQRGVEPEHHALKGYQDEEEQGYCIVLQRKPYGCTVLSMHAVCYRLILLSHNGNLGSDLHATVLAALCAMLHKLEVTCKFVGPCSSVDS